MKKLLIPMALVSAIALGACDDKAGTSAPSEAPAVAVDQAEPKTDK